MAKHQKKNKKPRITPVNIPRQWSEDEDMWEELEQFDSVERIRKSGEDQNDQPDKQTMRRQRQKQTGREHKRIKRDRKRDGNNKP